MSNEPRRRLAPWTAEEGDNSYAVRTANVVSITYFDDEPNRDFNLRKGRGSPDRPNDREAAGSAGEK